MPSARRTLIESTGAKLTKCDLTVPEYELVKNAIAEIKDGMLEVCPPFELYNKVARQRRHVGFFADPATTYGYFYSRVVARSQPPGEGMKELISFVNKTYNSNFNGVLVNYYPDGEHYISDHRDSEKGLDPTIGVVIISAGATRTMHFKRAENAPDGTAHFKSGAYLVPLTDGSMMAMTGPNFQKAYSHGIPKEAKASGPRWSFTFRHHTGENEGLMIQLANKTLARIAAKLSAEEEEAPVAKRAKRK